MKTFDGHFWVLNLILEPGVAIHYILFSLGPSCGVCLNEGAWRQHYMMTILNYNWIHPLQIKPGQINVAVFFWHLQKVTCPVDGTGQVYQVQ